MKKSQTHRFFFLLSGLLSLAGCSGKAPIIHDTSQEAVYMSCVNGSSALSYTVEGDRVLYIEQTVRTDREKLGIPDNLTQEQLETAVDSAMTSAYHDLHGVEASAKINGNQILITVKMDLEEADLEALNDRGLLTEAAASSDYVSWTKTKEALEAEQIACQPAEK